MVTNSSNANPIAAAMLTEGSRALAAHAAERLLRDHPESQAAFGGRGAFRQWQSHLAQRILELASALDLGEPALFRTQVEWARDAFHARGVDIAHLRESLFALSDALDEDLPPDPAAAARVVIRAAVSALAEPPADLRGHPPGECTNKDALRYLELVLSGDRTGAKRLILDRLGSGNGGSLRDVLENILLPAQVEIGGMWHMGELTIAEEHMATETTRHIMTVAADKSRTDNPDERGKVLIAVAQGDTHDVGARAVAELIEASGYTVFNLGADVPVQDVANAVLMFDPDALILAATIGLHIRALADAANAARDAKPELLILAGGPALMSTPDLAARIGADALATSPGNALDLIERHLQTNA